MKKIKMFANILLILSLTFYGYGCGSGGGSSDGSSDDTQSEDSTNQNNNNNEDLSEDASTATSLSDTESKMNQDFSSLADLMDSFQTNIDTSTDPSQLESDFDFCDSAAFAAESLASNYADWLTYVDDLNDLIPSSSSLKSSIANIQNEISYGTSGSSKKPNVNTEESSLLWDKLASFFNGVLDTGTTVSVKDVNDFQDSAIKQKDNFNDAWNSKADTDGNGKISSEEYIKFQGSYGSSYNIDKASTLSNIVGEGGFTVIKTLGSGVIAIGAGALAASSLPAVGAVAVGAGVGVLASEAFDFFFKPSSSSSGNLNIQASASSSSDDIYFIQGRGSIASGVSIPSGTYDGMFFVPGKGPIYVHDIPITAGKTFTITDLQFVDEESFTIDDIFGKDLSESVSFNASIVIDGSSVSFSPNLTSAYYGDYSGNVEISDIPTILATEASTLTEYATLGYSSIIIMTNPSIVTGAGTYNFSDEFFALEVDGVAITLWTPNIKHYTGEPVSFNSYGGSIIFSNYGDDIGDTISGSLNAYITGTQITGQAWDETTKDYEDVEKVLTGTINGSFNVTLSENPE